MVDKKELIEQTNLAFDFIQKLYLETSYLIREIEVSLHEEDEVFVIGKPGGYSVSARRSSGLESASVSLWLLRKYSVFFAPENKTEKRGGSHIVPIDETLRVLYLRIVLNDKDLNEPAVYSGILRNIGTQNQAKAITCFEHMLNHLEYNDDKIFKHIEKIDYEDGRIRIQGELIKNNLFEINNSEDIKEKIIDPSLKLFRK
jgi:hypothetical protein